MASTETQTMVKTNNVKGKMTKKFKDPMAITWSENYSQSIEKYWSKLPTAVASLLVFCSVFIFGATVNGKYANANP